MVFSGTGWVYHRCQNCSLPLSPVLYLSLHHLFPLLVLPPSTPPSYTFPSPSRVSVKYVYRHIPISFYSPLLHLQPHISGCFFFFQGFRYVHHSPCNTGKFFSFEDHCEVLIHY